LDFQPGEKWNYSKYRLHAAWVIIHHIAGQYWGDFLQPPIFQPLGMLNSGKTYPYGFGWNISNANGHRVLWHTGGNQGFFVIISRYVDDHLTIITMNNLDEFHCDTVKIAGTVASIYNPATAGAKSDHRLVIEGAVLPGDGTIAVSATQATRTIWRIR
jgi:CubicO group peptidase (beta-lactamase class C family)